MSFRDFVAHLQPFKVEPIETPEARTAEAGGYMTSTDTPVDDINEAQVISSQRRESVKVDDFFGDEFRHDVVLDIDLPAILIPSSTEGNSHLIVRLPNGGAETLAYERFLHAAADIGLIEQGYADVSCKRGRTDVRLPWVRKGGPGEPSFVTEDLDESRS